jgi:serine/threonine protein kinase
MLHEEYLSRPQYKQWLATDTLPITFGFMLDGIAALKELRSRGIIHRDLSPNNILWSRSANAWKLVDFDLAVFADEKGTYRNNGIVGTDGYIAKEILDGEPYSFASDFCSLGLVCHTYIFRPQQVWDWGPKFAKETGKSVSKWLLFICGSTLIRPDMDDTVSVLHALYGELLCYYRYYNHTWWRTNHEHDAITVALRNQLKNQAVGVSFNINHFVIFLFLA